MNKIVVVNNLDSDKIYKPGKGWNLVWSDEFKDGVLNDSNWNRQVEPAGRFNEEWQRYTDDSANAFIENGTLVLVAKHEGEIHGMDQYTSARLNTAGKASWKYGKIAARIKLPYGEGLWPAFWMLGSNIDENGGDTPWPFCGEIDILELYGSRNDGVVEVNAHFADLNGNHDMIGPYAAKLQTGKFADDFHVFEIEWNENNIEWFVDGTSVYVLDISNSVFSSFHQEFFILLNIAVGGTYSGRPDNSTSFPQFMYVDWIKVYQQN